MQHHPFRVMWMRHPVATPLLAGLVVLGLASPLFAADPVTSAQALRAKYTADVEELARWCEQNGLVEEAKKTRHVLPPSDPGKLFIPVLPETVGPEKLPSDAPEKAVEWQKRFISLRRDYSTESYELARRVVRNGRAALAFDLAVAGIEANPDSEPLRHLFGYQKYQDRWHTAYELRKLRAGQVWSDRFGWLSKPQLQRYDNGQRYFEGRWISVDDDNERHRDIASGWKIETEHYLIRTNHSIEGGVALGVKLERLYRIWEELFIRYYASEADVVALFNGRLRGQRAGQPRHEIIYFRDHDDYVHALQTALRNPNVAGGVKLTTGYYDAETRRAFFAANNEDDDSTMYHEATHQLFHESRRVAPDVGFKANFWIVEGIAMYMESLRREDGYFVLGGFQYDRMAAARHRLLKDQFYVPLEEFCGYGMVKLQTDPRIATLYSQAAGLTNFLIHYDNGRYRDALVQYLFTVYTGHDDSDTLARLTGVGYGELDKQYHAFMQGQNPQADGGKSRPASTP